MKEGVREEEEQYGRKKNLLEFYSQLIKKWDHQLVFGFFFVDTFMVKRIEISF